MKILHICLANFYIDNYSYQENMLPKFHKELGLDVEIIASLVSFDNTGKSCLLENGGSYVNEYDIPVTRLEYKKNKFSKRLRQYEGTYEAIKKANPDIIFVHGCQFLDIKYVVKYVESNTDVKIYVDNHADFSNSATNWLSKNALHKIIWRYCAKLIEPYTEKFYGVLPSRVDFLEDIYKVPENKTELLLMGADDDKVIEAKKDGVKQDIRNKFGISSSDFLIMTGGKIDLAKKQTLLLMKAIKEIENAHVKLIVFGSVVDELKDKVKALQECNKVQYIGWISSEETYKYFGAADLVIFPGRHSVFWEQVVGLGIPMLVKYWEGTTHVDVGGNCKFIYKDSVEEIKKGIEDLVENSEEYKKMVSISKRCRELFLYSATAKRSIELNS
ncbi:glycosyltransferase [Natronospora cellulosivora (SeqCode)]